MLKPACLDRSKSSQGQSVRIVTKHAKLDHLDQLLQVHRNKEIALMEMTIDGVESLQPEKDDERLTVENWRHLLMKDYVFRRSGVTTTELIQAMRALACHQHSLHNDQDEGSNDLTLSVSELRDLFPELIKLLISYQDERIEAIEEQRQPLQKEVKQLAVINKDLFEKMDYEGKGYITRTDLQFLSVDAESQEFFSKIFNVLDDTGCGYVTREKFDENLTVDNMSSISDRLMQRKMEVQRYRYIFNL